MCPFASHGKHLLPDSSGFYGASAGAGPPLRPFSAINIAFFAQICKENHCFAQKFSVSNRKYRLFLYSMTGQAHLPGHRSFCLFLCRLAGNVLIRLEAAGATPSVSSSSIPSFFCYYNRTARQIPWPASFPAFLEQYWKARGVRRGPFPFPFYALFPFFAQCRVMLETMALSSSAV